jgi:hypothetical protein
MTRQSRHLAKSKSIATSRRAKSATASGGEHFDTVERQFYV